MQVCVPQGILQENHIVVKGYIASLNIVNSFHTNKLLCRKIVHIFSFKNKSFFGHGLFKLNYCLKIYSQIQI